MAVAGNFRAFFISLGQKSLYFPPFLRNETSLHPHFFTFQAIIDQGYLCGMITQFLILLRRIKHFKIFSDCLNIFFKQLLLFFDKIGRRNNFRRNVKKRSHSSRFFPRFQISFQRQRARRTGSTLLTAESSPEYSTSARKTHGKNTERSDTVRAWTKNEEGTRGGGGGGVDESRGFRIEMQGREP